jgi:ribosomal protein L14E/L6E/L27E
LGVYKRKYCVIVNKIDNSFVEIDGQTRRRKCNINHLEALNTTVDIKAGANNKEVAEALGKKIGEALVNHPKFPEMVARRRKELMDYHTYKLEDGDLKKAMTYQLLKELDQIKVHVIC